MRVCPLVIQYYPHYITARKGKLIMEKSSNKLVDLSVAFAVEILNLVKYLKSQHETIICNQIGRGLPKQWLFQLKVLKGDCILRD